MKYAFYTLICLWAMACQSPPPQNFDQITYRYRDSSVEARFHRSFTIVLQANGDARVSVDVYGDTIARKEFKVAAVDFGKIKGAAQYLPSAGKDLSGGNGVTTQSIRLSQQQKPVYTLTWDSGSNEAKDVTNWVRSIKNIVPDLDALLATKHDVHSSELVKKTQGFEQTKALEIKTALQKVKGAQEEKKLLKSLWLLTQNNANGDYPLYVSLSIGIKDTLGKSVHINQRQQGHVAHVSLRGLDKKNKQQQKWEVKIKHQLLDMNNLAVLMYE